MASNTIYQPIVTALHDLVAKTRKDTLDDLVIFLNEKAEVDDDLKALIDEFSNNQPITTYQPARPAKKAKRAPSQYNVFIGEAIRKIKTNHPEMTSVQRMKAATEMWNAQKASKV